MSPLVAKFKARVHPSRKGDGAQRSDARLGASEYPAFVESLRGVELAVCDDHDWNVRLGTAKNFSYDDSGIYGELVVPITDELSRRRVLDVVEKRCPDVSVGMLAPLVYKTDTVDVCADISWVEVSLCQEGQMEGAHVLTASLEDLDGNVLERCVLASRTVASLSDARERVRNTLKNYNVPAPPQQTRIMASTSTSTPVPAQPPAAGDAGATAAPVQGSAGSAPTAPAPAPAGTGVPSPSPSPSAGAAATQAPSAESAPAAGAAGGGSAAGLTLDPTVLAMAMQGAEPGADPNVTLANALSERAQMQDELEAYRKQNRERHEQELQKQREAHTEQLRGIKAQYTKLFPSGNTNFHAYQRPLQEVTDALDKLETGQTLTDAESMQLMRAQSELAVGASRSVAGFTAYNEESAERNAARLPAYFGKLSPDAQRMYLEAASTGQNATQAAASAASGLLASTGAGAGARAGNQPRATPAATATAAATAEAAAAAAASASTSGSGSGSGGLGASKAPIMYASSSTSIGAAKKAGLACLERDVPGSYGAKPQLTLGASKIVQMKAHRNNFELRFTESSKGREGRFAVMASGKFHVGADGTQRDTAPRADDAALLFKETPALRQVLSRLNVQPSKYPLSPIGGSTGAHPMYKFCEVTGKLSPELLDGLRAAERSQGSGFMTALSPRLLYEAGMERNRRTGRAVRSGEYGLGASNAAADRRAEFRESADVASHLRGGLNDDGDAEGPGFTDNLPGVYPPTFNDPMLRWKNGDYPYGYEDRSALVV